MAANETHLTLPLLGAGLLVARRRPALGAALGAPFLVPAAIAHFRQAPRSPRSLARFVAHLPAAAIVGIAEVAATVRGAIQARTPLV